LPERLATTGDAIWFYLGKLLWPDRLMMVYPRWQIDAADWISYLPLLAAAVVTLVLWLGRNSWTRSWFFAWSYFLVALLPVIGLVDTFYSRYSFVADHFQYLASMGPLALAGAGIVRCAGLVPRMKWLLPVAGAIAALALGIVSWNRSWAFVSPEATWADTLAKNPTCWVAYNNLGNTFSKKGETDEAIDQYQKAIAIHPNYAEAESNLGNALLHQGDAAKAISHYRRALDLNPRYTDAHYNLGVALLQTGQTDPAMEQFQATTGIDPLYAAAHYNAGYILMQKGDLNGAADEFQKTLAIKPDYFDARNDLGAVYARMGKWDQAAVQFAELLRRDPANNAAQSNLEQVQAMLRQPASR
jgi:tetratricopeptide (TPR) repeat protein